MDIHFFNDLFESFEDKRIVILGDAMIDSYLRGKVERISPEAPVPILDIKNRENRLGGAANVALNIQALGAEAILCSAIGNDTNGDEFLDLMSAANLETALIQKVKDRKTSIKHRLIAGTQQLMRVDEEDRKQIDDTVQEKILAHLKGIFEEKKVDALILQDYNKGLLSSELNQQVIDLCKAHGVFVAVDPKKENFLSFNNCDLFKPNLKELREGLKLDLDKLQKDTLDEAVSILLDQMNCKQIMVTLSEKGVYGWESDNSFIVSAKVRDIADVSGAGDTVISVAALCLACGTDLEMASRIANLAGGLVCESVGVVPVDKEQLLQEAIMSIK